ncbi:MAG: DUF3887 domain-containing protein [Synechococcaceae cyanobacterium]|nr:DUF3887 domain-containing protein [Synechococcaceae cyanobacterium]
MPRPIPLSAGLLGLILAAAPAIPPMAAQPQAPAPRRPQPSAALAEEKARTAAERVLSALRSGDASTRFNQFAPSLQRMTSPELVERQIRRMPKVLAWRITEVVPGVDSSTVEAVLQTSAGQRELLMVIDADGLVEGYHFNVADQPAEEVTRKFIQALVEGRYVSAGGFLNPDLQEEIPPASLQRKWQKLERLTGDFVRIRRIAPSEHTPAMKLVMVTTEFSRLTDNLYVILDSSNEIIGVDFPTEPAPARPGR